MNMLRRIAILIWVIAAVLWIIPTCATETVPLGMIGVRSSNISGVLASDLQPGWHWRIPGIHRISLLPSSYQFLDYTAETDSALTIRTQDNNNVTVDVTVPYRVISGKAYEIMKAGNHVEISGERELFRFQQLAADTTVSVLREQLASLKSSDFYHTDRRLEIAGHTLEVLNEALAPLQLEAEAVLIRAVSFRKDYELQLQAIQLNEQTKLLNQARKRVAEQQQELDNFTLETNAFVAARQQEWVKQQAELERAYQVGFVIDPNPEDPSNAPGAVRQQLSKITEAELQALRTQAAAVLGIADPEKITNDYLLGIQNIEAETLEYKRRVTAESDGVAARLTAEGEASVAAVRGAYEARLNDLLSSAAGRAFVAWKSAGYIQFANRLTFHSSDGIPSVLRLRQFAQKFMGLDE